MPKRTRADFQAEWQQIGAAVADHLPPRLARRLLAVVRCLPERDEVEARDAVALLEESFGRARPRSLEEILDALEAAVREARAVRSSGGR